MLNKAMFQELAAQVSRNVPNNCPWKPMELLIRDNIGATLEQKIKACMGTFGFIKRGERGEFLKDSPEVTFFNFTVGHPEYRAQMQCSFYDEDMVGAQFEFQVVPSFLLMIINTAPMPDTGHTRKEETEEDKRNERRERQQMPNRLRAEDFDPAALAMFIELLATVTTDVMMKAIPESTQPNAKQFKEGALVYSLRNPDKVTAAHVVQVTGVNTVGGNNEVCDIGVFAIADQHAGWAHSSNFGTELEWNKAMKKFGESRNQRPVEFEGATQAEVDYIQGALVRIGAILRG